MVEPGKFLRTILAATSIVVALGVSVWLHDKFDAADRKAALGIVLDYHSKAGWSIPEVLNERHPGKDAVWGVVTEASCLQHERVSADVDDKRYEFVVDINGPSIHPGNKLGEGVLGDLDRVHPAAPAPSTSASAGKP
jgi:hypothetical protein